VASALGWMLDAMDVLLYSFVLDRVRAEFSIDDRLSGVLLALPLAFSAIGGVGFGWVADRYGRTRALTGSILVYSLATAACGLAQSVSQLAAARIVLGLGMGGEWAAGAALVAETWPPEHRGKALGLMQSAWAIGYGVAAAVNAIVLPRYGWRAVFFVGVLPAVVALWVRLRVPESPMWLERQASVAPRASLRAAMTGRGAATTWTVIAMHAATMFGWWGLFTWMPSFLMRPVEQGGAGLSILRSSTWIIAMQGGMWLGYVTFGVIADAVGRRRTYVTYLLVAAALVPAYVSVRDPRWLLVIGPGLAFFGTGYFSGFGAVTAELFPTEIRVTAQGLAYNLGRALSAFAPVTVGTLAASGGLASSLLVTSGAFLIAAVLWTWIPETRGRTLR
jgi:MFS family permease